jgi:hypothetical protein
MEIQHRPLRSLDKIATLPRIGDCTHHLMPIQYEEYAGDRTETELFTITAGRFAVVLAAGIGVVLVARWLSKSRARAEDFGLRITGEQAVTVKASLERVEAAWVDWCASGHATLRNNYAVRFEPAPGARGTEVHLSGGGSTGTIREELRRFKQRLETGQIPLSDGPGLTRPAQPRDAAEVNDVAEVL